MINVETHYSIRTGIHPFLSTANSVWQEKFTGNKDYTPLLCYSNSIDPLILGSQHSTDNFARYYQPHLLQNSIHIRKENNWLIRGNTFQFFSGYSSLIGIRNIHFMNLTLIPESNREWGVKADLDIFFLLAIKTSKKHKIEFSNVDNNLIVKKSDVVYLVNRDKLKKGIRFMNANYSGFFRRKALRFLKESEIPKVLVSNEYMQDFVTSGVKLNTNSYVEVMKLKDQCFDLITNNSSNFRDQVYAKTIGIPSV